MVNKLMTAALKLEMPDLAIDIFEDAFGFYFDPDPAKGNFQFLPILNPILKPILTFCVFGQ